MPNQSLAQVINLLPRSDPKAIPTESHTESQYPSRINNPPRVCDAPGASDSVIKFATEALFENFRIVDDQLAGREYFFGHFTAPEAHFFWCCRRATQLEVDLSGFPNVTAHFKPMQERPSVKKLLAYEEVNEGFAKTGQATIEFADTRSCREAKASRFALRGLRRNPGRHV